MLTRIHRKIIVKHFGGSKNFLMWVAAVALTIYVIDSYILTRDRLQSIFDEDDPAKASVRAIPGVKVGGDMVQHVPREVGDAPPQQEEQKEPIQDTKEEKPPEVQRVKPKGNCGFTTECKADQVPYRLKSGYGRDGQPVICWNGEYIFSPEKKNAERGINLVVVNDKTMAVEEVRTFDTYSEDTAFVRFLKLGISNQQILLIASMDEITTSLGAESKGWLEKHGAGKVAGVKFRDNYILMGQRGLAKGKAAVEIIGQRAKKDFANEVEKAGCLDLPMGMLMDIKEPIIREEVANQGDPDLKRGQEAPRCGVKDGCGPDAFPVHIYTGIGNTEGPKICVSGKYVLAKGLNDGGRGFNIVIVDPKTKDVIRVGHFDTYAEDSSNLEIFLEMMNEGEIIVAVTHDDASKNLQELAKQIFITLGSTMLDMVEFRDNWGFVGQKGIIDLSPYEFVGNNLRFSPLSDHAKKLFNELGSGLIQNVQFRDVWALVGQKGIDGFGYLEQYETRDPGANWPVPVDRRVCVPTEIKGTKIKPDPMANKNEQKRKFCAKYDGYGDFCQAERIDEVLSPAPLTDKSLVNHAIFTVPIIVIPGLNHNAVRMQLETILLNPGIDPKLVTVMYDEKFDEPQALAELFGFQAHKLPSSTKYVVQTGKALKAVWDLYPSARHVMVLEEEVIVGPDLLYFFSQCLQAVEQDDSLMGVSAWNVNGYQGVSGKVGTVYRTESAPGLGFLLKKSFYEEHMDGKMEKCCYKRSWDGWVIEEQGKYEMLVPDTSRVYRRPYEGLAEDGDLLAELYNRERVTNIDVQARISHSEKLSAAAYDAHVTKVLGKSRGLDTANVHDCLAGKGLGFYIPETTGEAYSVYYEQHDGKDLTLLSLLCKCFKLFHVTGYAPRGLHKGLLRFSYKDNHMLLVGSSSPFYKSMPSDYKPVRRSHL